MAIIGTLPNNIQNGQAVDANPVMADFNFIVNQVNANANPIGTLTAPSGTRTIFHQASAPLGWTQDATITDHTIQIVGGAGGAKGGASGYSGMFQNQWTSDGHALTIPELAPHSHGVNDPTHTHTDSGHQHQQNANTYYNIVGSTINGGTGNINTAASTFTAVASAAIQPSATGITTQATGSGSAHSHTKTFNALFVQMIMCVKT